MSSSIFLCQVFGWVDAVVIFAYLALTTLVGHVMRGKQATISDFFLGGQSIPWPAVTGSMMATAVSGVTFVGFPGMVFAANGNWTFLQWSLGAIVARAVVSYWFVPAYYEQKIFSPYDYMGKKLGESARRLATGLFWMGGILGQSVRVLIAALVLRTVIDGLDLSVCIWIITAFAILWTFIGGMRTVIWTDVIQFFLFIGAGLTALIWIVSVHEGGFSGLWQDVAGGMGIEAFWTAADSGQENKLRIFDFTLPWSNDGGGWSLGKTFWVALLAVPFLNLSNYGVDQLNVQRMLCCRDVKSARKAMLASNFAEMITLMMLAVGAALFGYYLQHPPSAETAELFAKESDSVFPSWIVNTMPIGVRAIVIGGIFAAAISSLDSILAALSQTSISLFVDTEKQRDKKSEFRLLMISRATLIVWGILLAFVAIGIEYLRTGPAQIDVVGLAFGLVSYTVGSVLALWIGALLSKKVRISMVGMGVGVLFSLALAVWTQPHLLPLLDSVTETKMEVGSGPVQTTESDSWKAFVHSAWLYPVNFFLTLGAGILGGKMKQR